MTKSAFSMAAAAVLMAAGTGIAQDFPSRTVGEAPGRLR